VAAVIGIGRAVIAIDIDAIVAVSRSITVVVVACRAAVGVARRAALKITLPVTTTT
jgi:hypothetical protein